MNQKRKIQDIQKIIDRYFKILESLPEGKTLDSKVAREMGIPPRILPMVERAYRYGRLQGKGRVPENIEAIGQAVAKDKGSKPLIDLQTITSKEDVKGLLQRGKTRLSRQIIEELKRNYGMIDNRLGNTTLSQQQIASELREITNDVRQDWDMVVRTELINSQQQGMASAILDGSSPYSDDKGDTIVFKRPNHDACKHCKRLYLQSDGVTPRLFRLSELMAMGDNIGLKVSEWKPTLGVVHPHCQCKLQVMPKGATFDNNGQIIYLGKGERENEV